MNDIIAFENAAQLARATAAMPADGYAAVQIDRREMSVDAGCLRRMEAAREQQRKYAAEEAEKKSLKEKRAEKQAAKSMKKKNSTSESGRVGDRPYARGRSYDPEHYGE